MLNRLTVKNVALIESAEIDFTKGFNVLSGETGSGKSVILESLNFVLGAKADKTLIRNGADDDERRAVKIARLRDGAALHLTAQTAEIGRYLFLLRRR